jgi:hypothetical protein
MGGTALNLRSHEPACACVSTLDFTVDLAGGAGAPSVRAR